MGTGLKEKWCEKSWSKLVFCFCCCLFSFFKYSSSSSYYNVWKEVVVTVSPHMAVSIQKGIPCVVSAAQKLVICALLTPPTATSTKWAPSPVVSRGCNSTYWGYNPRYPFVRPFKKGCTPFITIVVGSSMRLWMNLFLQNLISRRSLSQTEKNPYGELKMFKGNGGCLLEKYLKGNLFGTKVVIACFFEKKFTVFR